MTEKMDGCNLVIQMSRLNYEATFIVFVTNKYGDERWSLGNICKKRKV